MILTVVRNKLNVYESAVITNIEVDDLSVIIVAIQNHYEELRRVGFTEDDKLLQDAKKVLDALTS